MRKSLPGKEGGRLRNQVLVGRIKTICKERENRQHIDNWDPPSTYQHALSIEFQVRTNKRRSLRGKQGPGCKKPDSVILVYYPYYKTKKI